MITCGWAALSAKGPVAPLFSVHFRWRTRREPSLNRQFDWIREMRRHWQIWESFTTRRPEFQAAFPIKPRPSPRNWRRWIRRANQLRRRIAENRQDYATAERELKQAIAASQHPAFE